MNINPEQLAHVVRTVVREEMQPIINNMVTKKEFNVLQNSVDAIAVDLQSLRQEFAVHRGYEHPMIDKRLTRLENHTGLSAD